MSLIFPLLIFSVPVLPVMALLGNRGMHLAYNGTAKVGYRLRHKRMAFLFGLAVLGIGLSEVSNAQSNTSGFDPALAEDLQTVISQERFRQRLRGLSAAVIVPGQGLWQGVSGLSGPTTDDMITPETLFGIASVTKTFVAALILKLAEEGRLTLDDALHQWLPSFQHIDSTITLRHLLTHTSGIYNVTDNPAFWRRLWADPERSWTPEEVLSTFVNPPPFSAGSKLEYSNTNYLLLGMVSSAVTRFPVATQLRDRFWGPLGLNNTFLAGEEVVTGAVAHNWTDRDGDGDLDDVSGSTSASMYTMVWTAGSVLATAADVARWVEALYGGRVLADSSLDAMLRVIPVHYNVFWTGYGMGTMRFALGGETLWGHTGLLPGFRSIAAYWPEGGVSISVLVNQDDFSSVYTIAPLLLDVVKAFQANATAVGAEGAVPNAIALYPSYPNPFTQRTTIAFDLPTADYVTLDVYDIYGRALATLADRRYQAGRHHVHWTATGLASGVYMVRLQAGAYVAVRSAIVMK